MSQTEVSKSKRSYIFWELVTHTLLGLVVRFSLRVDRALRLVPSAANRKRDGKRGGEQKEGENGEKSAATKPLLESGSLASGIHSCYHHPYVCLMLKDSLLLWCRLLLVSTTVFLSVVFRVAPCFCGFGGKDVMA